MTAAASIDARVVLVGDAPLVEAARARLSSEGGSARVYDAPLSSIGPSTFGPTEVAVVLVQPNDEDRAVAALRAARPAAGAVVVVDEGPAARHAVSWYDKQLGRVSFSDSEAGWSRVWEALIEAVGDHVIPLGRRYAVLRPYASEAVIRKTSRQNGVIGVVFVIPGTDMPLMTINQIKMVLALAAIHGEEITYDRAVELLGVIGLGFGLRTVARQALDVVPGFGWAVKGAVAYTGTRAMGEGALRYFQAGAPAASTRLRGLIAGQSKLKEAAAHVQQYAGTTPNRLAGVAKRIKR